MNSMKIPIILAGIIVANITASAEARPGHGCLYAPRRQNAYDYHRRHRPNAIDLVSDMFSVPFYTTNSLFRQQQDQLARSEQNTAPRYSISQSEDGKVVELAMEVPGVSAKDLSVEVGSGNILCVRGSRTIRDSGSMTKAKFDLSFQLDNDIDVENISVSLSSGILSVTAPRKENVVKRIQLSISEDERRNEDGVDQPSDSESTVGFAVNESRDGIEKQQLDDLQEKDFIITEDGDSWQ